MSCELSVAECAVLNVDFFGGVFLFLASCFLLLKSQLSVAECAVLNVSSLWCGFLLLST